MRTVGHIMVMVKAKSEQKRSKGNRITGSDVSTQQYPRGQNICPRTEVKISVQEQSVAIKLIE